MRQERALLGIIIAAGLCVAGFFGLKVVHQASVKPATFATARPPGKTFASEGRSNSIDPANGSTLHSVNAQYGYPCDYDTTSDDRTLLFTTYCHGRSGLPSHVLIYRNNRLLHAPLDITKLVDLKAKNADQAYDELISSGKLDNAVSDVLTQIAQDAANEQQAKRIASAAANATTNSGENENASGDGDGGFPSIKTLIYALDETPNGFVLQSCNAHRSNAGTNMTHVTAVLSNNSGRDAYNVRIGMDFHGDFGWQNNITFVVPNQDSVPNGRTITWYGDFNSQRGVDVVRCYIRNWNMN